MKNYLNENVLSEWYGLLEQQIPAEKLKNTFGLVNSGKEQWLAEYCHNHAMYDNSNTLNESFAYGTAATLGNVPGMGAVRPGAAPGGPASFYTGTTGSGDKFPSLLPLAIQVAARTVGFDIVSVIPMPGPTGVLTYLDYVYGGGKPGTTEQPLVISVDVDNINSNKYTVGTKYWGVSTSANADKKVIEMLFIGYSRITGYPIFRIGNTYTAAADNSNWTVDESIAISEIFDTDAIITTDNNGKPIVYASLATTNSIACTAKAGLVRGLEDHIQGYSGAGTYDQDNWTGPFTDGATPMTPMGRGTGESTYYRPMNIQAYTKFIEAETYQVSATVTTEQIQDLNKQFGLDVVSMIENALVNEISQAINKHILSRAFALGWTNNAEFLKVEGATLNFTVDHTQVNALQSPYYLNKVGFTERIPVNPFADFGSFENMHTIQRRIQSKLIAAGNIIAQRGRRGPANFAVTNLQLATALQDSAQFTFAPMQNTINQSNGSLYPIGTLAGMTIYVDPNMTYTDNRILVGRKGEDQEPGLKFMPYLMAESIQTIAEGTMAPKIAVKSRYALVEAGQWPQTQYYTFYVHTGNVTTIF
jgi:hypothetical protein